MQYLFYTISFLTAAYILLDINSHKEIKRRIRHNKDLNILLNRRVIDLEKDQDKLFDKVARLAIKKKK